MRIEKLSAEDVDHPQKSSEGPRKEEAVEHLRESRNILTPFIGEYVEKVREAEVSKETLSKLRWVHYKGTVTPNFYGLLNEMQDLGVSVKGFGYFRWGDDPEESGWAYKSYLERNHMEDSPTAKANFKKELESIKEIAKKHGFDPALVNAEVLSYVRYNTQTLREGRHWSDFNLGLTREVLSGHTLVNDMEGKEGDKYYAPFPQVMAIPIGNYGYPTAKRIYDTIQIMLADTKILEEKSAQLVESHKDIFAKTARGEQDLRMLQDMSRTALKMLQEGIVTLGQAIAQLTVEQVPGYENDPDRLIEDLIKHELPNQLGYLAPPAYIGPFSLVGACILNLVQQDKSGKLILNPEVLTKFQDIKIKMINRKIRDEAGDKRLPAVGRGCPVSFKGQGIQTSGINELSQLFLELYKKNPNAKSQAKPE